MSKEYIANHYGRRSMQWTLWLYYEYINILGIYCQSPTEKGQCNEYWNSDDVMNILIS
jgi:hypothetical protein